MFSCLLPWLKATLTLGTSQGLSEWGGASLCGGHEVYGGKKQEK